MPASSPARRRRDESAGTYHTAINRFRVQDRTLDAATANLGASIAARTGASVADAHLGAVVQGLSSHAIVVLGRDPDDMTAVCQPIPIRAVRL